jgi:hypothetical protein
MASGHTREMLGKAIMRDREEPVRGFLLPRRPHRPR